VLAYAVDGIRVMSPAFAEKETIPFEYTGFGANVSPEISWGSVPAGTASIAVIVSDPDAPAGTWYHWLIYDIPPGAGRLAMNIGTLPELEDGSRQGVNDFKKIGYFGPMPPRGAAHRYFFTVYALDVKLDIGPGADKKTVLEAMMGHVLAEGTLTGSYAR
jgi:Raf kinase inhibitor-like YbhB/YbcL family protein